MCSNSRTIMHTSNEDTTLIRTLATVVACSLTPEIGHLTYKDGHTLGSLACIVAKVFTWFEGVPSEDLSQVDPAGPCGTATTVN